MLTRLLRERRVGVARDYVACVPRPSRRRGCCRKRTCNEAPEEAAASSGALPIVGLRVGPASRPSRAFRAVASPALTPSRLAAERRRAVVQENPTSAGP
jgi:hypothetical protein